MLNGVIVFLTTLVGRHSSNNTVWFRMIGHEANFRNFLQRSTEAFDRFVMSDVFVWTQRIFIAKGTPEASVYPRSLEC